MNFFILAFLILTFLFMIRPLLWLMDLIINHFFTSSSTIKFFVYSFLEVSPDIVALSFLTAISGTIGRLYIEREYLVFLNSGISAKVILKQFIIFSVLLVFVEFWLCFFVSPSAMYKRKILLNHARMDEPLKLFKNQRLIKEFPGMTIYVKEVVNKDLKGIIVSYKEGFDVICKISAENGRFMIDNSGYLYLFLENGSVEKHSIKKSSLVLRIFFNIYTFSLPYRKIPDFIPGKRIKEMNLPSLLDVVMSKNFQRKEAIMIFMKKLFFTFLPAFYLFLGFYTGISVRVSGYLPIIASGLFIGFSSYFIILLGEIVVYKTENNLMFLFTPLIFFFAIISIRRKFYYVT